MAKLNPMEDKDFEAKGGNYFTAGVHEVYLSEGRRGKSQNTGSEFVEFDVLGENDATTNVRLYLTEKAAQRTLSILGTIAVHNKTTEKDKQAVRDAFKKITDTDQLDDKFLAKFKDMQAWILTEEDLNAPKPNGGYYLRSNLYSYEPQLRSTAQQATVEDMKAGEPVDLSEIPF